MATTAVFSGSARTGFVSPRKARSFPSLSEAREASSVGDLTIHRITNTHHGRTLLTLGHAAEYLRSSRSFSTRAADREASVDAVHILMGLSRAVFDEYAGMQAGSRRFEDWVVGRAVRLLEGPRATS